MHDRRAAHGAALLPCPTQRAGRAQRAGRTAYPVAVSATPVVQVDLIAALRVDLEAAGFTVDGAAEALGPVAVAALRREQALPAELVTRGRTDPLALLIRLFTLGLPLPACELDRVLPTLGAEGAGRLGLVVRRGDDVVAACDLRPHADETHEWWVASDLSEIETGRPLLGGHVLGIGAASMTLAAWTIRSDVDRALDLGTGCGVQALHLAGHCRSIVATDVSQRALHYARFNAALGLAKKLTRNPG